MKKWVMVSAILIGLGVGGTEHAYSSTHADYPSMATTQSIHGRSPDRWAFMTAWNLSTGAQEMSSSWRTGRHIFEHGYPTYRQWIARFVYDQATGRTRDLVWIYGQNHVQ